MARPRAAHIPTDFWRQFIGAPNESPSFRGALRGNAQRVGTSMESAMTTIDSGVPALTFINVFTVAPKDQQRSRTTRSRFGASQRSSPVGHHRHEQG